MAIRMTITVTTPVVGLWSMIDMIDRYHSTQHSGILCGDDLALGSFVPLAGGALSLDAVICSAMAAAGDVRERNKMFTNNRVTGPDPSI